MKSSIEYTDEFGDWKKRTLRVHATKLIEVFIKTHPEYKPIGSVIKECFCNEETDMVEAVFESVEKKER